MDDERAYAIPSLTDRVRQIAAERGYSLPSDVVRAVVIEVRSALAAAAPHMAGGEEARVILDRIIDAASRAGVDGVLPAETVRIECLRATYALRAAQPDAERAPRQIEPHDALKYELGDPMDAERAPQDVYDPERATITAERALTSDAVRGDLHGTPDEWPERQPMAPDESGTPQAQSVRGRQSEQPGDGR